MFFLILLIHLSFQTVRCCLYVISEFGRTVHQWRHIFKHYLSADGLQNYLHYANVLLHKILFTLKQTTFLLYKVQVLYGCTYIKDQWNCIGGKERPQLKLCSKPKSFATWTVKKFPNHLNDISERYHSWPAISEQIHETFHNSEVNFDGCCKF